MSFKSNHIALFIDGANLHATARTLGFEIDFKRLLKNLKDEDLAARVLLHGNERRSAIFLARSLTDWLSYNGYTVVTKAVKEFIEPAVAARSRETWTLSLPSMPWSSPVKSTRWFSSPVTELSALLSRRSSVAASALR